MAEKDLSEKTLEAYNDVFADIVNVLLFNGEQVVREEDLEDAAAVSMYKADGKLHEQERDVSKYWKQTNIRISLFGIENQTQPDRDMPLRLMSYDGAAYRAQLQEDQPRYPVISLVLYFGYRHWNTPDTLSGAVKVPPQLVPYFNDYHANIFEIAFLTEKQLSMFKSDFRAVAEYFVRTRERPTYKPTEIQLRHIDEVLKLLSVMAGDHRFETLLDAPIEAKEDMTMSEWLDYYWEKATKEGEARGEARGVAIGEARGVAIGEARGRAAAQEHAARKIAAKYNIPIEELRRILAED